MALLYLIVVRVPVIEDIGSEMRCGACFRFRV